MEHSVDDDDDDDFYTELLPTVFIHCEHINSGGTSYRQRRI